MENISDEVEVQNSQYSMVFSLLEIGSQSFLFHFEAKEFNEPFQSLPIFHAYSSSNFVILIPGMAGVFDNCYCS